MTGNKKKNKNRNKKKQRQNAEKLNKLSENVTEDVEDLETQNISDINTSEASTKRQHDGDSDEEQPRRKKKKKLGALDESDKKGKKSIRQMKREKFAQRQAEAQAASKDQLKSQCLNYLSQWKHDKSNWKFMKIKQVWLFKNKFSSTLLPDASWPLLLEYFQSAQGNIRKMLLDDAKSVINQMDKWTESNTEQGAEKSDNDDNVNDDDANENIKPDDNIYKRARDIIQCFEE